VGMSIPNQLVRLIDASKVSGNFSFVSLATILIILKTFFKTIAWLGITFTRHFVVFCCCRAEN